MASVSLNLTVGSNLRVNQVKTGTNAPGTGDIELRINLATVQATNPAHTRKEVVRLLRTIENYILYGDQTVIKP